MLKEGKSRQGLIYCTFRAYLRFVHDRFFYRKVYRINQENIPSDGTPVLVVSNHQNCLCDPLGVLLAFKDRKPSVLVRADVFAIHPIITKVLHKMGLLPAYRLNFDGKELLWKNKDMFKVSEKGLLAGNTLLMYPEGMHQDKHWLGDFSFGYTKMAFEAAEAGDFQTEIFILPCSNHYSAYADIQNDMLIKFGTPISIKPYYELYKTKPRTAQRQVNAVVWEQLSGLMLNITDSEHYPAIDFLRNTYGRQYAEKQGFRPDCLPEKLRSDQLFFEALQQAKCTTGDPIAESCRTEGATGRPDRPLNDGSLSVDGIYADAFKLKDELERLKIRDDQLDKTPEWVWVLLSLVALVALFPVWLFALWPNLLIYKAPLPVMRRVKDKMFHNSFLYGMSVLITMPLLYTLSFVFAWVYVSIWVAVVYVVTLPFLGIFAWYYWQFAVRTKQDIHFLRVAKTDAVRSVRDLRDKIYKRLNNILK